MQNVSTVTAFDAIMAVLGVYLILMTISMKKTGTVPKMLFSDEEKKKLKNEKAFIEEIYGVQMIFSVVMTIVGIIGFVCDIFNTFPQFQYVEVIVFTVVVVIYLKKFVSAREKYSGPF